MKNSSSTSFYVRKAASQDAQNDVEKLFNELEIKTAEDTQKAKKDLITHFSCTQSWFMRISSFYKLKFMKQLFIRLKSSNSLGLILNALLIWSSKATYYALIQPNTNFVYDKMLLDNPRSINVKHMKKIEQLELEWFEGLAESEQTLIIVGLIRRSGGQFAHELFQFGERLHSQLATKKNALIEDEQFKTLLENRPKFNESEFNLCNTQSIPNLIAYPIASLSSNQENMKKIQPTTVNYQEEVDITNPFSVEVAKRKKIWDDLISAYRIQVEGKPKKESEKKEGKGKKGKEKKEKPSKKDKGSKEKKGELQNIDLIQMLPYWNVLKIFSYLDTKTLKKIKDVNQYWEFAVNELQKCLKARKAIDKLISQMAASVGPVKEMEEKLKIYKSVDLGKLPKKRLLQLSERGAAVYKLQKSTYRRKTTTCLLNDALKQMHEYYVIPVGYIEMFPRAMNFQRRSIAENVPKMPSFMINELGFSKIDKSDLISNDSFSIDVDICNFDNKYQIPSDNQLFFANLSTYTLN